MVHEQVSIGGGNTGAHGRPLDLEEMSEVEGEVDVGKDKLCELDKELSGWLGVGRALNQEIMFQGREAMSMGDVGVWGRNINSSHNGVRWEGRWVGIGSCQENG